MEMSEVFGNVNALTGVLSLTGGEAQKTAGIFQRLSETTVQALNTAFETVSQQSGFKFRQVLAGINVAVIQLGTAVLPVVLPMVQGFAQAVGQATQAFAALPKGIQKTIVVIAGLAAAVGPVLVAVGAVAGAIGALGASSVAWVGGVVAGLAGLALGWDKVKAGALAMWEVVKPVVAELGAFASEQFAKVKETASRIWPDIQELVTKVVGKMTQVWNQHGGTIVNAVKSTWDFVSAKVGLAVTLTLGSIETLVKMLNGDFSAAWAALQTTVKAAAEGMKRVNEVAVKAMISEFYLLKAQAGKAMVGLLEHVKKIGTAYTALPFVDPATKAAVQAGLAGVEKGMGAIAASVSASEAEFRGWQERAREALTAPFEAGLGKIQQTVTATAEIGTAAEGAGQSVMKFWDAAGNEITNAAGVLSGGFRTAADQVRIETERLKNDLEDRPIRIKVEPDIASFQRAIAAIMDGQYPDTAGTVP